MANTSNREDLTERRIRVFERRYGKNALDLACHAAFPLTLTSDLLYCLRENFVRDCPWYAVADILLSGLCEPAGYDLYEMEGKTRDRLLRRLCDQFEEQRLKDLANFMSGYITNRFHNDGNDRAFVFGDRPQWTALAYLSSDAKELKDAIKQELQKLTTSPHSQERIRWAALVESYADLLQEKGFQPLLLEWAQNALDGEPIQDEWTELASLMGVSLQPFKFPETTIILEDEHTEELQPFNFKTVTVNAQGKVVKEEQKQAFYFIEPLGEENSRKNEIPDEQPKSQTGIGRWLGNQFGRLLNRQPQVETTVLLGIEMVAIPGGTFVMGSPPNERQHRETESPQHEVTVQPFFLSKYLITQAQWRFVAQLMQVNKEIKSDPSSFKGDNRPVETVSWNDAVEFCDRLSQYTGRPYRLPTEAEWEYACRAGTTTPFHFGKTITTDLANYNGDYTYASEPKGKYRRQTTDVGSFPPNAFGLYDMHGNVWEWCADHWHDNYEGAPTDGSAWIDRNENDNRSY